MKLIPLAVTRAVGQSTLYTKAHSPAILFGVGVVGFGATVVMACKATLKVEDVLDDHQKKMMDVNTVQHVKYSDSDRRQDKAILYSQTSFQLVKLYAPAIALGTISVAALTGSHHILSKRNAALTAAYSALAEGFAEYRKRVVKEFGEEKDKEFRYGKEYREIVEETDKGPKVSGIQTFDPVTGRSVYARLFDNLNPNWQSHPEYNRIFIQQVQNYMNDRLHSYGHVFLNDVYRALGLDDSQAGAVVGWRLSKEGDNYIDFGLFNKSGSQNDFINGREASVLLDFNVDGVIFDKIEERA